MKRQLFTLLLLACSAASGLSQTPAQTSPQTPQQTTAIRAGRLIDPENGRESRNQVILVEGRKVKAVGPNVEIPAGARVVDLSSSTVMPGLFDAHTRLCMVVDDQRYIYSADDIRFIIEEAKRAGLKVAAHCWTREGAHNAAEAGVASIEHGNHISDEDLQLAKRNGVTMVFTPFPEWVLKQFRPSPEAAAAEYRDEIDRLRAGNRLGLTIAFGTDAIDEIPKYTRGSQAITWLDSYVAAGLAPRDILKAMTTNAARLLGVEATQGSIRPGMYADIIATTADPLEDINALKQVSFVMKYGAVVKDEKK